MISKVYSQDLSGKNTFRMKVQCRVFIEYDSIADLFELDFEDMLKPIKHIGGGSNLLFTKDFPGTILHSKVNFIEELREEGDTVLVSAGAGVVFDDLCAWAAKKGLWGPENLSHIPGEVGASAVQNIGAYGVEAKDIIRTVCAYDLVEEDFVRFDVSECEYGYRESMFKSQENKDRYIITHVVFAFSRKTDPKLEYGHISEAVLGRAGGDLSAVTPQMVRETITEIRRQKLPEPSELGSAGSFFKNPVVSVDAYQHVVAVAKEMAAKNGTEAPVVPHYDVVAEDGTPMVKIPAAWLIDQCGWKGRRSGNAAVYSKQPLVIVNFTGMAEPEEIVSLESKIIVSVRERFGIVLSPEVEHI